APPPDRPTTSPTTHSVASRPTGSPTGTYRNVGDVLHASLVFGTAGKSHKLWMAAVDGTGERNRGVPGSARIDGTIRGGDEGGDGEIQRKRNRRVGGVVKAVAVAGVAESVPSLLAASNNSFQANADFAFFPGARFTAFRLRP